MKSSIPGAKCALAATSTIRTPGSKPNATSRMIAAQLPYAAVPYRRTSTGAYTLPDVLALFKNRNDAEHYVETSLQGPKFGVWYDSSAERWIVADAWGDNVDDGCQLVALFVGEGDATNFISQLNPPTIKPTFHFVRHTGRAKAPFVAEVRDSLPVTEEDVAGCVAQTLDANHASWLAVMLNRGYHAQVEYPEKGNPPGVSLRMSAASQGQPVPDDSYDNARCSPTSNPKVTLSEIKDQINSLAGRLLTILDASISSPAQNTALKTLVRKEVRFSLGRFKDIAFRPEDEGNSEATAEKDFLTED